MTDPLSMTVAQVEALDEAQAAAVLAAWVKAKQAALPEALARSASKPHAKLAKKALYQLKSGGVAVAPVAPAFADAPAPLPSKEDDELHGTISSVLGTGDRALFFCRPIRGGGLELYQAIVSDTFGVVQFARVQSNRAVYRARIRQLRAEGALSLLYCPLPRILEELGRGVSMNERSGTALGQDMSDGLRELGVVALDPEWSVPAPGPADVELAGSSAALFDEREISEWLPPETQLAELSEKSAALKAAAADTSTFERQRAELAETISRAFFTPALRRVFGRRLWLMAELFEQQGRRPAAALARATASTLFHEAAHLPFATSLFTRAFTLTAQDKVKALLETMRQDRLQPPSEERLGADPATP
ncbi:MAG: hypothetical protein INH41_01845 [Myxococcaceae bacterium]|jgi:hypothetical protein|nr:hypothetical protein [Myxococcaceae bacterium]